VVKRPVHEVVRPDSEIVAPASNFNGEEAAIVRTIHPERSPVVGQHTRETRQGPSSSNFYEASARITSGGTQPSLPLSRFTGIAVGWRNVQRPRRRSYLSSARTSREVDRGLPE
jgi:hypothetical protein